MNTANIKKYAPKARQDFIAAMTKQAALYGVTAKGCEPMEIRGDLALIGSRTFAKSISRARDALVKRIEQIGFAQTMEQAAYSWFNRLCAIRYMEIHGYLDHGRRVLSTASGEAGTPQILDDCLDIELPGLDKAKVADLKLDGTQDEALYRELLLAQCHALHEAMPFLFEELDDATELLLPDNLTKTDSLIRALVSAIPEEDWQDVEIIGWLYQFYISEKKDQVIGKVVKSEDIPAATQLFTPNWIVQYLVQNSVGRQWLQTYPDSPLKDQMPYYIAPGEQPAEVQAKLDAVTPESIDPESIKVLDPACGSGHILVEAYKLLKSIYEERGYRTRDIPRMILNHNLFGLDIDDRAGQLAGFALMMLARQDDRRLFSRVASGDVSLNVLSLQETGHLDLNQLWRSLNLGGEWQQGSSQSLFESEQADLSSAKADNRYQLVERTLARFTEAKTFGSLIEVPAGDAEPLKELLDELTQLAKEGDSMQKSAALQLISYLQQAWVLAQRYDAVIANPPYIGSKNMNKDLKAFVTSNYKLASSDLYAAMCVRSIGLVKDFRIMAFMTPFTWMFLSSFEKFRAVINGENTLLGLVQPQYHTFFESAAVPICAYFVMKESIPSYLSSFIRLTEFKGADIQAEKTLEAIKNKECGWFYEVKPSEFKKIPNSPVAFWVPGKVVEAFENWTRISEVGTPKQGLITGDNDRFLRLWYEVSGLDLNMQAASRTEAQKSNATWFPFQKGGGFRKWYGNQEFVVNWHNDGFDIRNFFDERGKLRSRPQSLPYYFKRGITWTSVTISTFNARYSPDGFIYSEPGPVLSIGETHINEALGFINSSAADYLLQLVAPAMHYNQGHIGELIFPRLDENNAQLVKDSVGCLISLAKEDWDESEVSWDFSESPLVKRATAENGSIKDSFFNYVIESKRNFELYKNKEELINSVYIDALDLNEFIELEVKPEKVSLNSNPQYRYDGPVDKSLAKDRYQSEVLSELISYCLGCCVGRYSLDRRGLIYANSGGKDLGLIVDTGAYETFPVDEDGVIPLTDQEWFSDDATNRFREFVRAVWGDEHLQENLDFVAESLCLHAIKPKRGESALDTIRRYLSTQFYKDHMRTYKKRPIYWLFSSGKQKAFECLVYLHRYNEGTLARMRTEYVIPLTAKLSAYADKLEQDKAASASAAETKRLEKEINTLHKQQAELAEFDEKLRHYADQRISLDLDDGVKVNYGKFGDLLSSVKEITGKAPS